MLPIGPSPVENLEIVQLNEAEEQEAVYLRRAAEAAAKFGNYGVSASAETYYGKYDQPVQDVLIVVRGLPLTDSTHELGEVLRDMSAAITNREREEAARHQRRAQRAAAEAERNQ